MQLHNLRKAVGDRVAAVLYRSAWRDYDAEGFEYAISGHTLTVVPTTDDVDEEYVRDLTAFTYTQVGFFLGLIGSFGVLALILSALAVSNGGYAVAVLDVAVGVAFLGSLWCVMKAEDIEIEVVEGGE